MKITSAGSGRRQLSYWRPDGRFRHRFGNTRGGFLSAARTGNSCAMLVFIAAYLRRSTFESLRHPEQRRRRVSKDLLRSSFLKRRYHGTAKQNNRSGRSLIARYVSNIDPPAGGWDSANPRAVNNRPYGYTTGFSRNTPAPNQRNVKDPSTPRPFAQDDARFLNVVAFPQLSIVNSAFGIECVGV